MLFSLSAFLNLFSFCLIFPSYYYNRFLSTFLSTFLFTLFYFLFVKLFFVSSSVSFFFSSLYLVLFLFILWFYFFHCFFFYPWPSFYSNSSSFFAFIFHTFPLHHLVFLILHFLSLYFSPNFLLFLLSFLFFFSLAKILIFCHMTSMS